MLVLISFLNFINCGSGLNGQSNKRLISLNEVKQHQKEGSMWTVLKGRVYNLYPYMRFHPGGMQKNLFCSFQMVRGVSSVNKCVYVYLIFEANYLIMSISVLYFDSCWLVAWCLMCVLSLVFILPLFNLFFHFRGRHAKEGCWKRLYIFIQYPFFCN